MTILDVLKDDHKEVSELLKKISRVRSAKSREKFFVEMKQAVEMHSFLEQLIFYRALLDSGENANAVERATRDHQAVTDLMAELDTMPKGDADWMQKFQTLKRSIQAHVDEEESELFERATQMLSEEKLRALGAEMATKKAEQLAVQ